MSFLRVYTFCHNCVSNIEQVGLKCIIKQKLYAKKKTKQNKTRKSENCRHESGMWASFGPMGCFPFMLLYWDLLSIIEDPFIHLYSLQFITFFVIKIFTKLWAKR